MLCYAMPFYAMLLTSAAPPTLREPTRPFPVAVTISRWTPEAGSAAVSPASNRSSTGHAATLSRSVTRVQLADQPRKLGEGKTLGPGHPISEGEQRGEAAAGLDLIKLGGPPLRSALSISPSLSLSRFHLQSTLTSLILFTCPHTFIRRLPFTYLRRTLRPCNAAHPLKL